MYVKYRLCCNLRTCVFCLLIFIVDQVLGRDRQAHGVVELSSVLESAESYCKDMMSVHVFAVKDDKDGIEMNRTNTGASCNTHESDAGDCLRYYVVALLNDGKSVLLWHVRLTEDAYVLNIDS